MMIKGLERFSDDGVNLDLNDVPAERGSVKYVRFRVDPFEDGFVVDLYASVKGVKEDYYETSGIPKDTDIESVKIAFRIAEQLINRLLLDARIDFAKEPKPDFIEY